MIDPSAKDGPDPDLGEVTEADAAERLEEEGAVAAAAVAAAVAAAAAMLLLLLLLFGSLP